VTGAFWNSTVAKSLLARTDSQLNHSAAVARADKLSALCGQALASHQTGRLTDAIAHYEQILALAPGFSEVHNNRGLALAELGRFEAALESYRRAVEIRPDNPEALCNWGLAFAQLERWEAAEAKLRRAIAINSGFAGAYNNLGLILKERGRVVEARRAIEEAIRLSPRDASYYDNLAALRSFAVGDPYLTALEALAAEAASLSDVNRMHLHFALAKAHEQIGNTDSAFEHLLAANAHKRRQVAYDEAATLAQMERTRALFTPQFVSERAGCGEPSAVPVFIVGMPRSGTTLIEHILASHPAIFGAGELSLLEQTADAIGGALAQPLPFPELASGMSAADYRNLGARYLEKLLPRAPQAKRITDKMPANFLFAGLIHLALPNAVIIHAVRDPLDTCVSCFSMHFTRGHFYSYDLAELGRYYRHYHALMAHWRRVLPPGRIIEVRYEELVEDVEWVARRLVASCGLPWDARCLDFHRNSRPVRTASALQVRKPIYRSSIGRARRCEAFLGPLVAELAPVHNAVAAPLGEAG
jgi:Flp pilus assembly protein TadD